MGHISTLLANRTQGSFPNNTENNPKEEVHAIILRSEKQLERPHKDTLEIEVPREEDEADTNNQREISSSTDQLMADQPYGRSICRRTGDSEPEPDPEPTKKPSSEPYFSPLPFPQRLIK